MKYFFTLMLSCSIVVAFGQRARPGEKIYYFDASWTAVSDTKKAAYFTRTKKMNDTAWVVNVYHMYGPMIRKEVYKDKDLKMAHGTFIHYKPDGYMDSLCSFRDNLAHGSWYFFDSASRPYSQKDFDNGRLIKVYDRQELAAVKNVTKSEKEPELKPGEESEFPGPKNAWSKYLNRNLQYPERAIRAGAHGMVVMQFIVGADGTVQDIDLYKSVEFSLDEESIRMIAESPKWIPAMQDGKPVKSYKRQPIVYGRLK